MNESIDFYTKKLGLRLLDQAHYEGNADMAFVGKNWDSYIELVYDLEEHPPYQLGNRYEHLALEVRRESRGPLQTARLARRENPQGPEEVTGRYAFHCFRRGPQRHSGGVARAQAGSRRRLVIFDE